MTTSLSLPEKLLATSNSLKAARLPFAFGGAIALAYHVRHPRGTNDLDVNVFVSEGRAGDVLAAMPPGVRIVDADRAALTRDGQTRVWWGGTPIDLFLSVAQLHEWVAGRVLTVPFSGELIPVLDAESLAIFKILFGRPKDWVDLGTMLNCGDVNGVAVAAWVRELLGEASPQLGRWLGLVAAEGDIERAGWAPAVPPAELPTREFQSGQTNTTDGAGCVDGDGRQPSK